MACHATAMVEVRFLRCYVDPNRSPTPPRCRWTVRGWTLMRRQRLTAATMRPPRTRRETMAASLALPPAGPLPTPLRPAWRGEGGVLFSSNRFTGSPPARRAVRRRWPVYKNLGTRLHWQIFTVHTTYNTITVHTQSFTRSCAPAYTQSPLYSAHAVFNQLDTHAGP